jgi:hypothetical protein
MMSLRWIIFFALLPSHAFSQRLALKRNDVVVYVKELSDWKLGKDLFGIPFVYFSPLKNGQRSNLSFTDTGLDLDLEVKSLAKSQKDYENGRRAWAEQVSATPISFYPYEVFSNQHGHRVHQIGFSYEHQTKVYSERSYYVECRGRIIFSKSLRLRENQEHEVLFQEAVNSIDCGGV